MKCENIRDQLIDYIDQNLDDKERALFEAQLAECPECLKELEDLQQLIASLKEEPIEKPSTALHMNFEQLLEAEKAKASTKVIPLQESASWKTYFRVAASILLIISAFLIGRFSVHTTSSNEQSAEILEKITSQSASQRIAAISLSDQADISDTQIIQALINRLLYDDKPSVRLAAVEALTKFASLEMVKEALIKALETDKDHLIQIELIHLLAKLQEKRALPPMKNLLNDEKVPEYIKKEVKINIASIS